MEKRFKILKLRITPEVEKVLKENGVVCAAFSNQENAEIMQRALIAGDDPNELDAIVTLPFISL